jgi:Ca2+-binding RTX toxin-like protein
MELLSTDGSGAPTNTTLASAIVPDATVPIGDSTLAASFTATSNVTAGQQYALSVGRVDGLAIRYVRVDPCPGQEFQSTVGGSSWAPLPPFGGSVSDFVVSVFVTPPSQPGQPGQPSPSATCRGHQATIIGTNGADQVTGTPGADVILGLDGHDKLSGLAGNDVICGGKGADNLKGGAGNDQLSAQKGNDKLYGQKGNDKLSGKAGNDTLKGGPGKDILKGGAGNDKQVQ